MTPIAYTSTFTNNQLLDKMEMTLTEINVSGSPSTLYEVRADTIGVTATGRPLFVSVFQEVKDGIMENHDGTNWINNYVEFSNGVINNPEGFNGQVLIALTKCTAVGMTTEQIMTVTRKDTVISWLEVLDNMMSLDPDVDRDQRYLRTYGDTMDMEICRANGFNSGRDTNGIIMHNTVANTSHTLAEMYKDHFSLFDVFHLYCSIHWKTARTLCAVDRGARLFACVLWEIVKIKTLCHLPVKLIFYDEARHPVYWVDSDNRWTRRSYQ